MYFLYFEKWNFLALKLKNSKSELSEVKKYKKTSSKKTSYIS